MHVERGLEQGAGVFVTIGRIDDIGDDRNAGEAADGIGRGYDLVAQLIASFLVADRLGAQHQVRKVDIPLVRRHVGALGQVAEIAQVTVIDDAPVVFPGDAVDLHGVGFIDQVEQGRKRVTQAHTTTAAVTDIVDTLELREQCGFVIKIRLVLPKRVSRGRVETAFPGGSRHRN